MGEAEPRPLKLCDTTLRDGHQSLLATRMKTEDMLPIVEALDEVGFEAMEVWGGATFDVAHRFLNEDPWERLAVLKKHIRKTPLSMLLRGQNLVGYRNYADDVVEAFIEQAAETGIDRFRIFDALNDERNFETAFKAVKKAGKIIQGSICYSLTERSLGGPIYNIEYYREKARVIEQMGAHSLCVKDMAGILSPYDAVELIRALKETVSIPIQLHTHYTSGMASMTCLMASEAGVDVIDTALAPFALRSSQPAAEPIVVALEGAERDTGLNLKTLLDIGGELEKLAAKYKGFLNQTRMAVIDTAVLDHQVPGGMLSNMINQLKEADALDRIQEVYEELCVTRKDLGCPPLVTPTSQIVGIQAVQNVLFGRYKMISSQVKDLCYGLYGRTPAPINPGVMKLCLDGYARGDVPVECRPADMLEPELEAAEKATEGLARNIRDVLTYALYPATGEKFLKVKYGVEPADAKDKSVQRTPTGGSAMKIYKVCVDGEYFEVGVEERGRGPSPVQAPQNISSSGTSGNKPAPRAREAFCETSDGETAVEAPLSGMVVDVKVATGDAVDVNDVVVIIEAMKMENEIRACARGEIKAVLCKKGERVEKQQALMIIG